ncbi:4'-phosphopantetheinyl transferase superfamily protein [Eubacterium sp. 1001713B170207_170306_E7]|uniref:4'-phosphopantetheinyl transferase family protein n=1 Tax=Eubacterium sp. 1001713B170207_170306_E7 TaxID=2787097 RepID=UPI00189B6DF3|nr:4'-phosphopantetheinyl transferase superfamily protein [Eubacterium sp. 1001713B170207_170306_E7]
MKLFCCNIQNFPSDIDLLLQRLPQSQWPKINSFLRQEDRLRCLGGRLLLAQCFGPNYDRRIFYNPYGKPFIDGGLHFNLSHSGDFVVLALSDQEVGVDVQHHENGDYLSLSKIAFHESEQQYLKSCGQPKKIFYTLWSLKESYMKAVGTGFSMPSSSFSVSLTKNGPRFDTVTGYTLMLIPFYPEYSLAVCLKGQSESVTVENVQF